MNERLITELAEQACQPGFDYEKFAVILVEECMRMCDVAMTGYLTHCMEQEANGCATAKQYIADLFEVD